MTNCFRRRELMEQIRNLREVREASDQSNGTTTDPAQMEELQALRQKKDELELRMSSLQETRKELMSQLEGLMSILKVSVILFLKSSILLFKFLQFHQCIASLEFLRSFYF